LWFALGALLVVAPLGVIAWRQPGLFLGRAGQVSILSPAVNDGDLWGALLGNVGRSLGLFLWRGDPILRHNALLDYETLLLPDNPAGRPVFDLLMAIPFLIGLIWSIFQWRRPPAAALLLWQIVMLGPTLLAADAPHFLRAAGLLPAVVFLPALGLTWLWNLNLRPATFSLLRRVGIILLLLASLAITIRDYQLYARQPHVGYLFEAAARDLARSVVAEPPDTTVYMDERFWAGWPSIPFLAGDRDVNLYLSPDGFPALLSPDSAVYAWPYSSLGFLAPALPGEAWISVEAGALARGDLEETAYSLYTRYGIKAKPALSGPLANFDHRFLLRAAETKLIDDRTVQVGLSWQAGGQMRPDEPLPVTFVHVLGPAGLVAQSDALLAGGLWAADWWRPGLIVTERRTVQLPEPFDPRQHRLVVGLYDPETLQRLLVVDAGGRPLVDEADQAEIKVTEP
jgi:hypothetical protein